MYYDGKNHKIKFWAFLETDAYNREIYNPDVEENKRQEYLDYIFQAALYRRETEVNVMDRLILLSTCTSDSTNGRHILVGKISDEIIEGKNM